MELFKPTLMLKNISDIDISYILNNKYKLVIFDMNNTITDYYTTIIPDKIKKLILDLKQNNIKIYILTNSLSKKQVKEISNILNIDYVYRAFKPLHFSTLKILKQENIKNNEAIIIGDHIFTDILNANICKIDSILVNPLNKCEKIHSRFIRKIENIILKKYIPK